MGWTKMNSLPALPSQQFNDLVVKLLLSGLIQYAPTQQSGRLLADDKE